MDFSTNFGVGRRAAARATVAAAIALAAWTPVHAEDSPTISAIKESGVLRAGVAIAAPGLMQDPATSEYIGPSATIVEAVAARLGVEVDYVDSSWDTIIAGLQANSYEIAIAPLYATPKRLEVVDIVDYYQDGVCYIVRGDNPKTDGITTYDELGAATLDFALVEGASYNDVIQQKYTGFAYSTVAVPAGGTLATEAVLAGRADVTVVDSSQSQRLVARFPELRVIPEATACIESPDFASPVGVALRKEDPTLTALVKEVVAELQPQIREEILKYTSPDYIIRD